MHRLSRCFTSSSTAAANVRVGKNVPALRAAHNRLHDRRDLEFVLHELEGVKRDDSYGAIFDACESFVSQWSHADAVMDKNPPQLVPAESSADGHAGVRSHPLTKDVVKAAREQGLAQISELGLPFTVQCGANVILGGGFSSNIFGLFTLTRCAADLLDAHGSPALRDAYLGPLRSTELFGTMALSEPHAGSSLATIRTMAVPEADADGGTRVGAYRVRGTKMWTTGAFHDLSHNIVRRLMALDCPRVALLTSEWPCWSLSVLPRARWRIGWHRNGPRSPHCRVNMLLAQMTSDDL